MDMIRNRLIPIVGAGALVAVVAIAMAGDDEDEAKDKKEQRAEREGRDGADRGERRFRGSTKICRQLKCDESQDEPLKEILTTFKDKKRAADQAIRAERKVFAEAYGADEVDDTKMREAQAEIVAQRKATFDAAHEGLIELHGLLSPEQRASLAKIVAKGGPLEPFEEKVKGGKKGSKKGRSAGRGRDPRRDARVDPRRSKESRRRAPAELSEEEKAKILEKRAELAKEAGKEAG